MGRNVWVCSQGLSSTANMPLIDSVDKIISVYLASVCSRSFLYKGNIYQPKPLIVSPLIFRGFTCPSRCGGCCPRFSLDYLPSDDIPYALTLRTVEVNYKSFTVLSDTQDDHRRHFCRNLDMNSGRCQIHGRHPFSCDFELIRFIRFEDKTLQTQKLFNRGWAMLRVDGGRGAGCEMPPVDEKSCQEVVRKLGRLRQWAEHFEISTHLATIIHWAKGGPQVEALRLKA